MPDTQQNKYLQQFIYPQKYLMHQGSRRHALHWNFRIILDALTSASGKPIFFITRSSSTEPFYKKLNFSSQAWCFVSLNMHMMHSCTFHVFGLSDDWHWCELAASVCEGAQYKHDTAARTQVLCNVYISMQKWIYL